MRTSRVTPITQALRSVGMAVALVGGASCASVLGYDNGLAESDSTLDGGLDSRGTPDSTVEAGSDAQRADASAPPDVASSDGGVGEGCIPTGCPTNACGMIDDGCGHQTNCQCSNTHAQCITNQCVCKSDCTANGYECGSPPDPCSSSGGTLSCGACQSGESCNAFKCTAGNVCTPLTCASYQQKGECGSLPSGCDGGIVDCSQNCSAPNTCVGTSCCTPTTCANVPANSCGSFTNTCDNTTFMCNTCISPAVCSKSGSGCCTPATTCPPGICNTSYTDPCTGTPISCGPCAPPDGGGCIPNCKGKPCGAFDGCFGPCTGNSTPIGICPGLNQCDTSANCNPCPVGGPIPLGMAPPGPCSAGTSFSCEQQYNTANQGIPANCAFTNVYPNGASGYIGSYCCQ